MKKNNQEQLLAQLLTHVDLTAMALTTRMRQAARLLQASRIPNSPTTLYALAQSLEQLALDVQFQRTRFADILAKLEENLTEP